MTIQQKTPQHPQAPAATTSRVLGRQLARELSKEEVEAIAGGMMKTRDVSGTGSGIWGNKDD